MAVTYQDYYKILGVERTATQDEIQSAYRKLARTYHPDVNQTAGAEEKFKGINEAYEVLKDPDNRKKYDQLGMNWKTGDEFRPPPGWESSRNGGVRFRWGGGSDDVFGDSGFSDFFESFFGGFGRDEGEDEEGFSGLFRRRSPAQEGQNLDAELEISLEDALSGGKRNVTLTTSEERYRRVRSSKSYQVNIPKGVTDGKRLRLRGQGGNGHRGGRPGDLFLTIRIKKHPTHTVLGKDLEVVVAITAAEAALGAKVEVPLVRGSAEIDLPPGIEGDKRIRIKGRGLGTPNEGKGDIYARVRIVVPHSLSNRERELYEELWAIEAGKPRGDRH